MFKSLGKPGFLVRLRSRMFTCIRTNRMDEGLKSRIRPFVFGGYACWCDKSDATPTP